MFSWLINLVLGNMPIWIWPAVAGGGVVLYLLSGILSHIPECKPYAFIIKPLSVLAILAGVFMYGGAGVTAIYQAQIKDMQNKIDVAEAKSQTATAQVQTKIVTQTKVIHDKQIVYQDRIKQVTKEIDADCKFDKDASKIINDAATNPVKATK